MIKKMIRIVTYGTLFSAVSLFGFLVSKNKSEYIVTLNPLIDIPSASADIPPPPPLETCGDCGGDGDASADSACDAGDSAC